MRFFGRAEILFAAVAILCTVVFGGCEKTSELPSSAPGVFSTQGWKGGMDGVRSWRLPTTPDGLRPTQSWHAVGSSPEGDIYVAGMDHRTNAALYRLEPAKGVLRYVGDARSAASAAGNLAPGEGIQKFHTRPHWHRGRVYLANLNRSYAGEEWREARGFHWFAYDPQQEAFLDLSAREPGGTAAAHGGIVSLTSDPFRHVLYGAQQPEGRIYKFDIARGETEDLGRPLGLTQPYVYAARALWVDGRGRLYVTLGKAWYTRGKDAAAVTGHVHVYDPERGWTERKDWRLAAPLIDGSYDAVEVGQWTLDRKTFFMADDRLRIYRFDEAGPSFAFVGQVDYGGGENWVWHVAPSGKRAYFAPSDPAEGLFEYDLEKKTTRRLAALAELDPSVGALGRHTGYDAWDLEGRFYFASFQRDGNQNAILTAVDPVRLKAAKGWLPSLQRVGVAATGDGFEIFREGGTEGDLEVLYRVAEGDLPKAGDTSVLGRVVIPSGRASVLLEKRALGLKIPPSPGVSLRVLADGDTYVLGASPVAKLHAPRPGGMSARRGAVFAR